MVGFLFPWFPLSSDLIIVADLRLLCCVCVLVVSGVEKVPLVAPVPLSIAGCDVVSLWSLCGLDDCCWGPPTIPVL